jgi:phage baseplate assembly protein gpV
MALGGPSAPAGDHVHCGVCYALVTQNDDDGPGGRVKVRYPWLPEGASDQSHWAQLAVPMAGDGFGTYTIPEVGDTVLVVFLAGDVRRPVVIGGAWNEEDSPPEVNANGKNDFRLIKSRSGHRLLFDDSGKTKVVLSDRTNTNVAGCGELGKGGSSDQNATELPAPSGAKKGVAAASTGGKVNLSCPSGTLSVSAREIEIVAATGADIKAGGALKLESPATARVSSSGPSNYEGSTTKVG